MTKRKNDLKQPADKNFDKIAKKFAQNIYGTSKGIVRQRVLMRDLSTLDLEHSAPLSVIDIGGGQGQIAIELAKSGHHITLCDISSEMLSIAKQRVSALGLDSQFQYVHAPLQQLPELLDNDYDLVMCHAVFEWLTDARKAMDILTHFKRAGGVISLMFYNLHAKRLGNILVGNFDYVRNGLQVKKTVSLNPQHPLEPQEVLNWCDELSLNVIKKSGVRCFHDYLKDPSMKDSNLDEIIEMELAWGEQEPYASIARYMHLLLK